MAGEDDDDMSLPVRRVVVVATGKIAMAAAKVRAPIRLFTAEQREREKKICCCLQRLGWWWWQW